MKSAALIFYLLVSPVYLIKSSQTDQNTPGEVPIAYLQWYRANMARLNQIPLYTGGPNQRQSERLIKGDKEVVVKGGRIKHGGRSYRFYKPGAEQYIKEFENSGFVSEVYMNTMREHFNLVRDHLKGSRQNDGNPDGLDYDFILRSQEANDILKSAESFKVTEKLIDGDIATVTFSPGPVVKLSRNNGRWMIDTLGF